MDIDYVIVFPDNSFSLDNYLFLYMTAEYVVSNTYYIRLPRIMI